MHDEYASPSNRHVELYRDAAGEWRWRRKAHGNHKVTADGSEGYTREDDARSAAEVENPGMLISTVDA